MQVSLWSVLANLVIVALLLCWGMLLCRPFRLPTGFAPLLGVAWAMVLLQAAGACNLLWPGVILFLLGGMFAGGRLLYLHQAKGEALDIGNTISNEAGAVPHTFFLRCPAAVAFLFACLLLEIVFLIRPPQFLTWDEFSHWGVFFKNVFYSHRFTLWMDGLSFMHQSYPQGGAAFYALFALGKPYYREADALFSTAVPLFAAASALFSGLPKIRRAQWFFLGCALVAVPALFSVFSVDTPYVSAYMDAPVGALFAGCMLLLCQPSSNETARSPRLALALGLLCAAVATVKEIGAVFALCALGLWLVQFLLARPRTAEGTAVPSSTSAADNAHRLRRFGLCFAAVAGPFGGSVLLWKAVVRLLGHSTDQFSSMSLSYFFQCLTEARSGTDLYLYQVLDAFYSRARHTPLLFGWSSLKAAFVFAAIGLLLCGLILRFGGRRSAGLAAAPVLMIFYFPCYLAVLFYVYIGGMSAQEALQTASFARYVGSYFIAWAAVLFGCGFSLVALWEKSLLPSGSCPQPAIKNAARGLRAVLCLLLAAASVVSLLQRGISVWVLPDEAWRTTQRQNAEVLRRALRDVGGPGEDASGQPQNHAWLLCADGDTAYQQMWYYHYELYPTLTLEIEEVSAQAQEVNVGSGALLSDFSERGVHWLILLGAEDSFVQEYAPLFSDALAAPKAAPDVPVLYRVDDTSDGGYSLTLAQNLPIV